MAMAFDPYASGVLDAAHHSRLVADLSTYAFDAGIQPHWICTPLPGDMCEGERDYLRRFRKHSAKGVSGLALTGKNEYGRVETHMAAMAGALVRNFIRARVMTLGTVLDMLPRQEMPDLACLLIPNFFLSAAEGGSLATWHISSLFDYLTYRHIAGLQTVIYASSLDLMDKEYGLAFRRMVQAHYKQL